MRNKASYFSCSQLVSAVLMIIALLWLTVSTPFVFKSQQRFAAEKHQQATNPNNAGDEDNNPFGSTTEEKGPSSTTLSEEYLHHHDHSHYHFVAVISSLKYAHANASTYVAFHGELLVPPPNQA